LRSYGRVRTLCGLQGFYLFVRHEPFRVHRSNRQIAKESDHQHCGEYEQDRVVDLVARYARVDAHLAQLRNVYASNTSRAGFALVPTVFATLALARDSRNTTRADIDRWLAKYGDTKPDFKPGDSCMSHTRYVKETGQIWFACQQSGFYVIELKPELRKSLGFPTLRAN